MICLPLVESVLSNAPNAVTGISPNQYLFGNLFTAHRGLHTPFSGPKPSNEYLDQLHALQPLIIQSCQRYHAEQADKNIQSGLNQTLTEFPPGSYVVVTYPERPPHKLAAPLRGPFLVQGTINDGLQSSETYIVQDLTTGNL